MNTINSTNVSRTKTITTTIITTLLNKKKYLKLPTAIIPDIKMLMLMLMLMLVNVKCHVECMYSWVKE
jgi:hypothetical protein